MYALIEILYCLCQWIIMHQVLHDTRVEKLSLTSQFFAGGTEYIVGYRFCVFSTATSAERRVSQVLGKYVMI